MSKMLLSDLAVDQLREITPATGRQLLNAIQRLRTFPESASRLLLPGYEAYRQIIIRPYRIIYRFFPEDDQVRIYCVLHVRRNLPPAEFLTHQVF
jgi:plasmid stabilization system protein ParE